MTIQVTSLKHPTIRAKLHDAMLRAADGSRQMQSCCRVDATDKIKVMHIRYATSLNRRTGFVFLDGYHDITDTVLKALRANGMPGERFIGMDMATQPDSCALAYWDSISRSFYYSEPALTALDLYNEAKGYYLIGPQKLYEQSMARLVNAKEQQS